MPGVLLSGQKHWPADRLRAVAVDGKTSRGARRADGTRVHLLGVAEHGGRLPDHLEVDVKHNETSHFTELPGPVDLAGAVVTFDALHTVRANLDWLVTQKNAQYIAVVKRNQPLLHAQVSALPWRQVPAGSATREKGHGRAGTRTVKAAHVSGLDFPHARQAIKITRWRQDTAPAEPPARPFTPSPAWPAPRPPSVTWPAWSASSGPSRIARQTAPVGSQRAGQGPIIGREGLLRLVEVVERLRARECGRDVSSWTREEVAAPNPGAGDVSAVGGPSGGQPAGGGALARGDRGQGGACGENGTGPGSAGRCGR